MSHQIAHRYVAQHPGNQCGRDGGTHHENEVNAAAIHSNLTGQCFYKHARDTTGTFSERGREDAMEEEEGEG